MRAFLALLIRLYASWGDGRFGFQVSEEFSTVCEDGFEGAADVVHIPGVNAPSTNDAPASDARMLDMTPAPAGSASSIVPQCAPPLQHQRSGVKLHQLCFSHWDAWHSVHTLTAVERAEWERRT